MEYFSNSESLSSLVSRLLRKLQATSICVRKAFFGDWGLEALTPVVSFAVVNPIRQQANRSVCSAQTCVGFGLPARVPELSPREWRSGPPGCTNKMVGRAEWRTEGTLRWGAFFQPFNLAKTALPRHQNTRTARLETRTYVCRVWAGAINAPTIPLRRASSVSDEVGLVKGLRPPELSGLHPDCWGLCLREGRTVFPQLALESDSGRANLGGHLPGGRNPSYESNSSHAIVFLRWKEKNKKQKTNPLLFKISVFLHLAMDSGSSLNPRGPP